MFKKWVSFRILEPAAGVARDAVAIGMLAP
jgi:hypothetical protein